VKSLASEKKTLTVAQLEQLIPALQGRGYQVVGPVVHEGAIVYDVVEKLADLPVGWTDEQAAGRYRLHRREDQALFGYVVGPHSWKKYLHPAEIRLFVAEQQGETLRILNNETPPPRLAFLGVRACELAAIAVQDRVLQGDRYRDPIYSARRRGIFVVAVNCTQAASTCFCTSMKTGPHVASTWL
jgi:sulfhydrogenase subunit beta (sulfur reductase)